uniref:Uncharacterized protein n=1 Tax=viral metagenome TaxID=1070528 RepID=A0A6C0H4N1_9ZZZZ
MDNIIKKLLNFYLNKENKDNLYKYFRLNHTIQNNEYDTQFDDLCNKNIIILKTKLNDNDSRIVFCLFKTLFDNDDPFNIFNLINDLLIPEILEKENINKYDGISLQNIKQIHNIDAYDFTKYGNEWNEYIYERLTNNSSIKIIQENQIPNVVTYKNYPFLKNINSAIVSSQTIFTIQDIIQHF